MVRRLRARCESQSRRRSIQDVRAENLASCATIEPYVWHTRIVTCLHEKKTIPRLLPQQVWESGFLARCMHQILLAHVFKCPIQKASRSTRVFKLWRICCGRKTEILLF